MNLLAMQGNMMLSSSMALTGTLPNGTVGVAYSANLTLTGAYTTPITMDVSSGTLPSWMTVSQSLPNINYAGTPTTAETETFTPRATDSSGTPQVATDPQSIVIAAASAVDYFDPAYTSSDITLSGSNAIATRGAASDNWRSVLAKTRKTTGKWVWEVAVGALSGKDMIGFGDPSMSLASYPGADKHGFGWHSTFGSFYYSGSPLKSGSTYATGAVLVFAMDIDAGMLWAGIASTWQNSGNPVAGTGSVFTVSSGNPLPSPIGPAAGLFHSGNVATLRVKSSEFTSSLSAGCLAGGFSSLSGL